MSKKELTKEERINEEYEKLLQTYQEIPQIKQTLVYPQLQNLSFMKVTLEDLQRTINQDGCGEIYQNGANQSGRKATAEVSAYNALVKNYYTLCEKMEKYLPVEGKASSKLEGFMNK